jgi:HK97 family phage prohead protease
MERKSINFELKDIDKSKRTAVIAHAVYNNIDRTDDISRKGMFTKSWNETKDEISFYFNHDDELAPGKVVDVYEDDSAAYTKAWLGTHTLGNDVLIMMDEGVIKKASFGYITEKSNFIDVKGKKIRELKEVKHIETSVLTKMPANPKAGVRQVIKAFMQTPEFKALSNDEQVMLKKMLACDQMCMEEMVKAMGQLDTKSDLYTGLSYMISQRASMMGDMMRQLKWNVEDANSIKSHIKTMENFCRNTNASDDAIKTILLEIEESKQLISGYNTVITQAGENPLEPTASVEEKELLDVLTTFNKHLKGSNGKERIRTAAL